MTKVTITTSAKDGVILMREQVDLGNDAHPFQQFFTSMMDTREAEIRKALMKLGWTPPAASDAKFQAVIHFGTAAARDAFIERYFAEMWGK